MNLSVAIVGLPNVGKSTLFNALLKRQQALAANYPFATIEPNTGIVEVPDERLKHLAETVEREEKLSPGSVPVKPATIEFVDIAGLVAGAAKGEGLGNQFLAHIRECDLICHVLRAFVDPDVVVTGKLDPGEDLQTVRTELILKDLETLENQRSKIKEQNCSAKFKSAYEKLSRGLGEGKVAHSVFLDDQEKEEARNLFLLTAKPEIFVLNVGESQLATVRAAEFAQKLGGGAEDVVVICARVEAELSELSFQDQKAYLRELGLEQSGIEQMAQVAYRKLNLISFLTAGVIEARAWTLRRGDNALRASSVIHTDFAQKFIKAKVIDWQEFVQLGGWKQAAEAGKVRQEGRDYVVQDGDVVEFMIGK